MARYRVMWNDGTNTDQGQYRDVDAESREAAAFGVGAQNAGVLDSVQELIPVDQPPQ